MEVSECSSTSSRLNSTRSGNHFTLLTDDERRKLITDEHKRKRQLRLNAVRAQSAQLAKQLRDRIHERKRQEMHRVRLRIKNCVAEEKEALLGELETAVHSTIQEFANDADKLERDAKEEAVRCSERDKENQRLAALRHKRALEALKRSKDEQNRVKRSALERRKFAEHTANLKSKQFKKNSILFHPLS